MFVDKITIHEIILIILALLVLVVFFIIVILLYSIYKYRGFQNRIKWTEVIEHTITDTIVEGPSAIGNDSSLKPFLKEQSFRNLFLSVLVSSNTRFSGSAQNEVLGLFHSFGLENDAWKKVKKKSPYLISGGIHELTSMRVNEIIPELLILLNHPNRQVYQEAQYSLVYFQGFAGLFFLNDLKTSLSDWQQLRLLKSISKTEEMDKEQIAIWLKGDNKSVVMFSLRLISQFQLFACYPNVLELLDDDCLKIRKQVIITLQGLEQQDTNERLIKIFDEEDFSVQMEILKMLKISKDVSTTSFLKQIIAQKYDPQLKIIAAETLLILGEESYLKTLLVETQDSSDLLPLIIKHALRESI